MHASAAEEARARKWHARALGAFSKGKNRSARASLLHAARAFRAAGDSSNAACAYLLAARAAQLDGESDAIGELLKRARLEIRAKAPAQVEAPIAFAEAEHAARTLSIGEAHVAASRAWKAAHRAGNASLAKEVERFEAALTAPVAQNSAGELLDSAAVSDLLRASSQIVVDGHGARVFAAGIHVLDLGTQPVLVEILSVLAHTSEPIAARALAREVFRIRTAKAVHEARLLVHFRLLRKLARGRLGELSVEGGTYRWRSKLPVVVLAPLAPLLEARLESLLARGPAWSFRNLTKLFGGSAVATKKALKALSKRRALHAFGAAHDEKWVFGQLDPIQLF